MASDTVRNSIISGVILILLGLFINTSWTCANEGKNKAYDVEKRITVIETRFDMISSDLKEIKDLLRKSALYGRNESKLQ